MIRREELLMPGVWSVASDSCLSLELSAKLFGWLLCDTDDDDSESPGTCCKEYFFGGTAKLLDEGVKQGLKRTSSTKIEKNLIALLSFCNLLIPTHYCKQVSSTNHLIIKGVKSAPINY